MPVDCLVCGKATATTCMGMDACRACTVFYRRNRYARDKLRCSKSDGKCDKAIVLSCRKCRLDRFEELMLAGNGDDKSLINSSPNQTRTASESGRNARTQTKCRRQHVGNSIIERIKTSHKALSAFRRTSELTLRGINIDPAADDEERFEIVPCTYWFMNEGVKFLIIGLFDFINSTFPEFRFLQISEKWLLIRNYGNMFHVIDAEFRAEQRFGKEPPGFFGSYSTLVAPDTVFTDHYLSDCPDRTNIGAGASALHSLYNDVIPKIRSAIHAVNPTEDEYFALMGLSFWSLETFDASDKLLSLATRHRTKLINELSAQYRTTIGEEKGASRVGSLLCLLQELRVGGM